jgi:PPOX class probable F420-dependent enzyme
VNQPIAPFKGQRYFLLESYRRDGTPVRTPLWFVEHGGEMAFYTMAASGKVKRLARNPRVRVAPCTARGTVTGAWVDGTARRLEGAEAEQVYALLNRKYGWQRRLLNLLVRLRPRPRVSYAIRLD